MSEFLHPKSPTEIRDAAILATANTRIAVERANARNIALDNYLKWKNITDVTPRKLRALVPNGYDPRIDTAERAFALLYPRIPTETLDIKEFKDEFDEADTFLDITRKVNIGLNEFSKKMLKESPAWGTRKRLQTAAKISWRLPTLNHDDRARVLEAVGYEQSEVKSILASMGYSTAMYAPLFAIEDSVSEWVWVAGGAALTMAGYEFSNYAALASLLVIYATKAVKIEQTLAMVKDERISATPNPSSVLGYHLFQKMFADKPHLID